MESIWPQSLMPTSETAIVSPQSITQTAAADSPDRCHLTADALRGAMTDAKKAMVRVGECQAAHFRCQTGRDIHSTEAAFECRMRMHTIDLSLDYLAAFSGVKIEEEQQ